MLREMVVLQRIREAQENGFVAADGRVCPDFAVARAEIEQGVKRSHWIWYVWPSLSSVRSNVRYPQFLLPSMLAARDYLKDPVLAEHLVDVSQLASAHLESGVAPSTLFGKQHEYDVPKFREAMTVFAVAARLNGDAQQEITFLAGLRALRLQALDEHSLDVLSQSVVPGEASAAAQVAAYFESIILQNCIATCNTETAEIKTKKTRWAQKGLSSQRTKCSTAVQVVAPCGSTMLPNCTAPCKKEFAEAKTKKTRWRQQS